MPPLFYMQKANFGFAAHHSFAAVLKYILNKKIRAQNEHGFFFV